MMRNKKFCVRRHAPPVLGGALPADDGAAGAAVLATATVVEAEGAAAAAVAAGCACGHALAPA